MPKPPELQPQFDPERNALARQKTWRDLFVLVENPDFITSEPNTLNDPDYPQWMKVLAADNIAGTLTWEAARVQLYQRNPTG